MRRNMLEMGVPLNHNNIVDFVFSILLDVDY